jgi:putative transposase
LYLAVILDLFSRRVVGWALAKHIKTELVLSALQKAFGQRVANWGFVERTAVYFAP